MQSNEKQRDNSKLARGLYLVRRARMPLALASLSIFVLGEVMLHLPPGSLPRLGMDKMLHVICYGTFTGLALLMLSLFVGWQFVWRTTQGYAAVATTLLMLAALGYLDEITQPFTGRRFEWSDLAANVVGILLCGCCFFMLGRLVTRPVVHAEA